METSIAAVPPTSAFRGAGNIRSVPLLRPADRRHAESWVARAPDSRSSAMRPFHMILQDAAGTQLRRVDFHAEGPDHAFQIARNESDGVHVELWQGATLLARMTKSGANKIGRASGRERVCQYE